MPTCLHCSARMETGGKLMLPAMRSRKSASSAACRPVSWADAGAGWLCFLGCSAAAQGPSGVPPCRSHCHTAAQLCPCVPTPSCWRAVQIQLANKSADGLSGRLQIAWQGRLGTVRPVLYALQQCAHPSWLHFGVLLQCIPCRPANPLLHYLDFIATAGVLQRIQLFWRRRHRCRRAVQAAGAAAAGPPG